MEKFKYSDFIEILVKLKILKVLYSSLSTQIINKKQQYRVNMMRHLVRDGTISMWYLDRYRSVYMRYLGRDETFFMR